jgi:hypothetical protein
MMATVIESQQRAGRDVPPDGDMLYEVVNGLVREVPGMGALAGYVASVLAQSMGSFVTAHKLGVVVIEVLFRLKADGSLKRRPDIAFVSWARCPDLLQMDYDPPESDQAPNLAVEVVSPTNTAIEIEEKIDRLFSPWRAAGLGNLPYPATGIHLGIPHSVPRPRRTGRVRRRDRVARLPPARG